MASQRMVVGAAIVDDLALPTRLLAARRCAPSSLAGGWELPGGKVEPGEGPEAALHREIEEELGVRVRLGPVHAGPVDGAWPLAPGWVMTVWWAELVDGEPEPLEDHDELRWLTADTLGDVAWLPADLPVIQAARPRLQGLRP